VRSYSQTDFATAQALREGEADNKLWWQGQINEEQQELIEIQDLLRFYRHPQKYFLQQRLNIRLEGIALYAERLVLLFIARYTFQANIKPLLQKIFLWMAIKT
jgi:exonuclease V gamma subunit